MTRDKNDELGGQKVTLKITVKRLETCKNLTIQPHSVWILEKLKNSYGKEKYS